MVQTSQLEWIGLRRKIKEPEQRKCWYFQEQLPDRNNHCRAPWTLCSWWEGFASSKESISNSFSFSCQKYFCTISDEDWSLFQENRFVSRFSGNMKQIKCTSNGNCFKFSCAECARRRVVAICCNVWNFCSKNVARYYFSNRQTTLCRRVKNRWHVWANFWKEMWRLRVENDLVLLRFSLSIRAMEGPFQYRQGLCLCTASENMGFPYW